jgi:hypothetical protein
LSYEQSDIFDYLDEILFIAINKKGGLLINFILGVSFSIIILVLYQTEIQLECYEYKNLKDK